MERQRAMITECDPWGIAASPNFYPRLFDGFMRSLYQKWKTSLLPWQLRVVGGPGSGKTSLATLVVQDLGNSCQSNPGRVLLSAFFSTITHEDDLTRRGDKNHCVSDLTAKLLSEIERQLDRHVARTRGRRNVQNGKPSKHAQVTISAVGDDNEPFRAQYERIQYKISQFSDVYLVIDDLDLAWLHPREHFALEEKLAWLDGLGVRILATSRTYYQKNKPLSTCDVELPEKQWDETNRKDADVVNDSEHRDLCIDDPEVGLVAWWDCVMCAEDIGIDPDDVNVVCEACRRRGHGCTKAEHASAPLSYQKWMVYIDMGNVLDQCLEGFIQHLLQSEHGQFILSSPAVDNSQNKENGDNYPPLSNLGRQLLPPIPVSPPASDHSKNNSLQASLQALVLNPSSDQEEAVAAITSRQAIRMINLLHGQSEKNMANLLCRLETINEIETEIEGPAARMKITDGGTNNGVNTSLEAVFELENSDRLPRSVVAMFDAVFEKHVHNPLRNSNSTGRDETGQEQATRAAIALHAIRHLARSFDKGHTRWVKFWDLRETLLEEDVACGHGFQEIFDRVGQLPDDHVGDEEDAENKLMDYIVSTAAGLLSIGRGETVDMTDVGFFHSDFGLYVSEDYNQFLASGRCC